MNKKWLLVTSILRKGSLKALKIIQMIKEWIFQKYLRKLFLRTIRLLQKNIKIKIPIMTKFRVQTGAAFFNSKIWNLSIIK